jgi:hypothetical protein
MNSSYMKKETKKERMENLIISTFDKTLCTEIFEPDLQTLRVKKTESNSELMSPQSFYK